MSEHRVARLTLTEDTPSERVIKTGVLTRVDVGSGVQITGVVVDWATRAYFKEDGPMVYETTLDLALD